MLSKFTFRKKANGKPAIKPASWNTSETGTLRFSASVFNTPREADAVLELL